MNEEQMEKLADLIVEKLMNNQSEMDDQFNEELKSMIDSEKKMMDSTMDIDVRYTMPDPKDDFISLHEIKLEQYISDEDYVNAAKTKKILEDYINNL